ncbi:E3 ubiquitin-protein ligase HUWE1, partial [Fragariocoptes setiger]
LVWESTVLISITSADPPCLATKDINNSVSQDAITPFGRSQLERLPTGITAEGDVEEVPNLTSQTVLNTYVNELDQINTIHVDPSNICMDLDETSKSAAEKKVKIRANRVWAAQIKLIKPLLSNTSRLGKTISELFTLLVKLSVGSPIRHRSRNHTSPAAPVMPSLAAQNVATALATLLSNGLSWHPPSPTPPAALRSTFYICSIGFTQTMLFDEKKYPYHLMLRNFVDCGGLDAFFSAFDWIMTEDGAFDIEMSLSQQTIPEAFAEFLDSWLSLLEKMVNPRVILETPHTMPSKSNAALGFVPFDPVQYLITVHKRAFKCLAQLWNKKPSKFYGEQMTDSILSVMCHLLRGEAIINEQVQKHSVGDSASNLQGVPPGQSTGSQAPGTQQASAVARPSGYRRNELEDQGINPDHFQQLVDMGFAREHALDALLQSQSIEQATEYLLSNPSSSAPPSRPVASQDQDVDMPDEASNTPSSTNSGINKKEEPLSKDVIDKFTEGLLPGSLRLLDSLPNTVYRVCDLILTVSQRNGEAWCETLLTQLLDDIVANVRTLLELAEPMHAQDKRSFTEWAAQLKNAPEAEKVAVRVHLYSLLFEEMKIICAHLMAKRNAIENLVQLLEVALDLFVLSKDKDNRPNDASLSECPRWLASTLLLIDLYEKGAVASQRRAPLLNS